MVCGKNWIICPVLFFKKIGQNKVFCDLVDGKLAI